VLVVFIGTTKLAYADVVDIEVQNTIETHYLRAFLN